MLNEALRALMAVLRSVCEQISRLDCMARQHARQHLACRHLMGIPGVGPMTAAAFVTAIDDPNKFRKSKFFGRLQMGKQVLLFQFVSIPLEQGECMTRGKKYQPACQ